MSKPIPPLQELLTQKLGSDAFDIIDLVQIPTKADRMVRMRTLEDALDDFDGQGATHETVGYLIQVRPRVAGRDTSAEDGSERKLDLDHFQDPSGLSEDRNLFARLTDETLTQAKQDPGAVYVDAGKLNIPFLLKNAELLFVAGDFGLARNIYRAVVQSGERPGHSLYWLGRCLEAEGKLDEAKRCYEESITYDPTLEAYQNFAALLIRARKDEEAGEAMERALALANVSPSARFELHKAAGNCFMRAEKADKAQTHYLQALAIDPNADALQANLGALHLQAGNQLEARKRFETALGANPRNDKALSGLGSSALVAGDKRAAHDFFARSLGVHLNNPTAIFHLVKCAYEIKSYATAARIVADYIEIAPVNTNLLYSLAGLQYHLGRIEEAQITIAKIFGMQPEHAGAKELLGMIGRIAT